MYLGYPSTRKHPLLHQYPYVYSPATAQVPMTPMDFSYSQSMLPANLLSSPSPYAGHPTFAPLHSPYVAHHLVFMPLAHPLLLSALHHPPMLPMFSHFPLGPHALGTGKPPLLSRAYSLPLVAGHMALAPPQASSTLAGSLEHLNFSRSVCLCNLLLRSLLHALLDEIEYGPIALVKLVDQESAEPEGQSSRTDIKDTLLENAQGDSLNEDPKGNLSTENTDVESVTKSTNGNASETTKKDIKEALPATSSSEPQKVCVIAFVNSHIAYNFYQKYKSHANLRALKDRLDLPTLKIVPLDASLPYFKQDYIKVKTFNYIMDVNATRAINITFKVLDLDLVPLMEKAFRARCSKFGLYEEFVAAEDDVRMEMNFTVHFFSIEEAIELYEFYNKRLNTNEDEFDDIVQLSCLDVSFGRDRCDRTEVVTNKKTAQKYTPSSVSASLASSSIPTSPYPSEKRLFNPANRNRSSSFTNSQESLRFLGSKTDLKAFDVPSEDSEFSEGPSVQPQNGFAASEQAQAAFSDDEARFERGPDVISGSDGSGPPSPSPDLGEYFDNSSMYTGFTSEQQMYPQATPFQIQGISRSANSSFVGMPNYLYNHDPVKSCNRTIYLGNLHPKTTVEEIANNVRAGGLVESIKYIKSKRMCFVTFIDPAIALKFYLSHQVLHQLIIRENEVNVCWGKLHSGPLSRDIAFAVQAGASRNVYIGLKTIKGKALTLKIPDEETLRHDFSKFGEMEQINYYHNKDCGFMNFMNISDAIRVVESFEERDVQKINRIAGDNGEFYEKYCNFKISYGKDRCGNPLKFSFKKRESNSDPYYRDRDRGSYDSVASQRPRQRTSPIDQETAMVFGISTNADSDSASPKELTEENLAESTTCQDDMEGEIFADAGNQLSPRSEGTEVYYSPSEDAIALGALSLAEPEVAQNDAVASKNDDSDSDSDEDDINIIIEAENSNSRPPERRPRRRTQKVYHNNFHLSDLLNATYSNPRSAMAPGAYQGGYAMQAPTMPLYYPQMPPLYHSKSFQGGLKYAPMHYPYGQQLGSGSQVMAEYLAKSQQESYMYAAAAMNSDFGGDEYRDPRRRRYSQRRPQ